MSWLFREWGMRVSAGAVWSALHLVAKRRPFHPVRAYLDGLVWDGVDRVRTWLTDYVGVEDTPYARLVGGWFLKSAVARVREPGCKSDHVLVLEGPQGVGKSSAARALAWPFYSDSSFDISSKDAFLVIQGVWIVELAEMASATRAEASKLKQFLTSQADRFRPPYERSTVKVDRQCVFIGTINESEYLKDDTGNRRFWPVLPRHDRREGSSRQTATRSGRRRRRLYAAGEKWYLDDGRRARALRVRAEPASRRRPPGTTRSPRTRGGRRARSRPSIVLTDALSIPISAVRTADAMRVGKIMKALGYTRRQRRVGGRRRGSTSRPRRRTSPWSRRRSRPSPRRRMAPLMTSTLTARLARPRSATYRWMTSTRPLTARADTSPWGTVELADCHRCHHLDGGFLKGLLWSGVSVGRGACRRHALARGRSAARVR